jgi:hypothetical protein
MPMWIWQQGTHKRTSLSADDRGCQSGFGEEGGGCCAQMTIKEVVVQGKGQGWLGSGGFLLPTLGLKTVAMDLWPALACARATLLEEFFSKAQLRIVANNINPGSKSANMEISRLFSHNGTALSIPRSSIGVFSPGGGHLPPQHCSSFHR